MHGYPQSIAVQTFFWRSAALSEAECGPVLGASLSGFAFD